MIATEQRYGFSQHDQSDTSISCDPVARGDPPSAKQIINSLAPTNEAV